MLNQDFYEKFISSSKGLKYQSGTKRMKTVRLNGPEECLVEYFRGQDNPLRIPFITIANCVTIAVLFTKEFYISCCEGGAVLHGHPQDDEEKVFLLQRPSRDDIILDLPEGITPCGGIEIHAENCEGDCLFAKPESESFYTPPTGSHFYSAEMLTMINHELVALQQHEERELIASAFNQTPPDPNAWSMLLSAVHRQLYSRNNVPPRLQRFYRFLGELSSPKSQFTGQMYQSIQDIANDYQYFIDLVQEE